MPAKLLVEIPEGIIAETSSKTPAEILGGILVKKSKNNSRSRKKHRQTSLGTLEANPKHSQDRFLGETFEEIKKKIYY